MIRPASYCGIVGVKPTYDLLSRKNVYPLSWSLDHIGYMTRTTQDAHIMLEALTGIKKEWHSRVRAPKVGLLAGYFKEKATEEVWQGFEKAVAEIWGEGADVDLRVHVGPGVRAFPDRWRPAAPARPRSDGLAGVPAVA